MADTPTAAEPSAGVSTVEGRPWLSRGVLGVGGASLFSDHQRNETVFSQLQDHRTESERQSAIVAKRTGREELDAILAARHAAQPQIA